MTNYRLGRVLGYGAKTVVQEAWQRLPDGREVPVAIKRLLPEASGDTTWIELMCREAEICRKACLGHPNLVSIYGIEKDTHGRPFLVLERVDGISVSGLFPRRLPEPIIRRILYQTLEGLDHVHSLGVIHRDISPHNILISRLGEVRLSDFGFASLQGNHSQLGIRGTAPYTSPESFDDGDVDERADLYALAAMTYELITGRPPFGVGGLADIKKAMDTWKITPLGDDVSEDLRMATMGLLERDPGERAFHSAEALLDMLDEHGGPVADLADLTPFVERGLKNRGPIEVRAHMKTDAMQPIDEAAPTQRLPIGPPGERPDHHPRDLSPKPAPKRTATRTFALGVVAMLLAVLLALGGYAIGSFPGQRTASTPTPDRVPVTQTQHICETSEPSQSIADGHVAVADLATEQQPATETTTSTRQEAPKRATGSARKQPGWPAASGRWRAGRRIHGGRIVESVSLLPGAPGASSR